MTRFKPQPELQCTVSAADCTRSAADFDEAFREGVTLAYGEPGLEVRIAEPGQPIVVLFVGADGALTGRRE